MKKLLIAVLLLILGTLGWEFGISSGKKDQFKEKTRGFWKKVGLFMKKNAPKVIGFVKEALL